MKGKRFLFVGLGLLVAIGVAISGHGTGFFAIAPGNATALLAQAPPPPPSSLSSPSPSTPPSPASSSPTLLPAPSTPPAPPASTAPPLALSGDYTDPAGQFKIGVLQNSNVTPVAGAVLVESKDGNLAYSVIAQAQPVGTTVGLANSYSPESLARIATTVFQRGEGFQPGLPQPESGGGTVVNWTGSLTIAGKSQPVGGVILVRPTSNRILLLLIAATEAGSGQVPGAVSALANSLQPL